MLRLNLASFVNQIKLVKTAVRNCPVTWNWPLLLKRLTLRKTKCATVLLLEIGVRKVRATVFLFEIGDICWKAKICPKHRAQHYCCSKLASKLSAVISLCLKLVTFVEKLKLVQNPLRSCSVAWKWRQNALRNCRFVLDWRLLLRSENLSRTPCATVVFLEIWV